MTIDEAFAAVSHAFPKDAEWQGLHFRYAVKNGITLIEQKKSRFIPESTCNHCGQEKGTKDVRFYYWLLVGEQFLCIHASRKSKFTLMRTILGSLSPSSNYL